MGKKAGVLAWAMYDFANNIFAMNVISLYFALWVTVDKGGEDIFYSFALSASMLLSAVAAPVVGMISDKLGSRRVFLVGFTLLSVIFTALIGVTKSLFLGLFYFAVANLGYQLAATVYNALLPQVSEKRTMGRASGYGKAVGYMGAIAGLFLVRPFVEAGGRQAAFMPTAALFLLFALPCFIFVKDTALIARPKLKMVDPRDNKGLMRFLLASFVVLNAISTIMVFMSVYANKVIGFSDAEINSFLIVSTLVGILGCFTIGFITDKIGAKSTLMFIILLWCGLLALAALSRSKPVFWVVGPLGGVALGSTWVVSRVLAIELAPKDAVAQVFGLFGLTACISAITGPLIWGTIVWYLRPMGLIKYRIALMSLVVFCAVGLWLLKGVPAPARDEIVGIRKGRA